MGIESLTCNMNKTSIHNIKTIFIRSSPFVRFFTTVLSNLFDSNSALKSSSNSSRDAPTFSSIILKASIGAPPLLLCVIASSNLVFNFLTVSLSNSFSASKVINVSILSSISDLASTASPTRAISFNLFACIVKFN